MRHESVGSFRHTRCLLLALVASPLYAANPAITLQVSSETAPPGGYAQFKISLTAPALVSTASISMTFDPTIFGPVANVAAFSATGDQIGYANVNGQQLTASASSPSAGLGQLPGLPVLIVTVPVLATAQAGTSSVTIDPTQGPWQDQQGNTYTVSVNPGTFTVGGTLSVESVPPGGGLLPSGTVVTVNGTGFDATTTVTIDGVSLASTKFVSAQQINVTIGGATELTGKHLHVQTGGGAQSDFFCSLPSAPSNAPSTVFPLMPFTTYTNVSWAFPDNPLDAASVALLNQSLYPVTVTFFFVDAFASGTVTVAPAITIPPGELYLLSTSPLTPSSQGSLAMISSAPIRMLEYSVIGSLYAATRYIAYPPGNLADLLPPVNSLLQPSVSPSAAAWTWQIGAAVPQPATTYLRGSFPFTATVSSAPWLSVSPSQGSEPSALTLTPNVSALGAGSYTGTITIKSTVPPVLSAFVHDIVVPVTMQVGPTAYITTGGLAPVGAIPGSVTPLTTTINVSTNGTPAPLSISVSTTSGGNWLSAPATGSAPGSTTITLNPSGLPIGYYLGYVVIQGPVNSVTVEVDFQIALPRPPVPPANPPSLSFALAAGTTYLGDQLVILSQGYSALSVATQSGGNWLTASFGISINVFVGASAVGLSPGTYLGTITLTGVGSPLQIPVTLVVLTPSAPLTVTPSSVSLTTQVGVSATQSLSVTSSPPTLFGFTAFTPGWGQGGVGGGETSPYTPSTVTLGLSSTVPGTHYGSVVFTSGSYSVTVPVMLTVTASPAFPPILGSIVGAASGMPSAISPGEIITLYGTGIGSTPTGLTVTAGKVATTLSGTQVLIDNAPAPLIYESSSQINAIVPYEAGAGGMATVQVITGGLETATWAIPLAPSALSIFTATGSGVGQAAVVNQDGSINSASNPAPRGTAIQIYATGGGQTSPPSSTGSVAQAAENLALFTTVTIGGVNAQVLYAGSAPGEVDGVVQINAIVPPGATPGSVPILVTIGGVPSQTGVTIAIQ